MTDIAHTVPDVPRRIMLKALLVAVLISGALSSVSLFYPIESLFYALRSQIAQTPIRDDVVMIGIDDKTLAKYGGWPLDRQVLGDAIRELDEAGAKQILFDFEFADRGMGREDPLLKAANEAKAPVYFGVLADSNDPNDEHHLGDAALDNLLIPDGNTLVYLGANTDFMGVITSVPKFAALTPDQKENAIPSLASQLNSKNSDVDKFIIDYSKKQPSNQNSFLDIEQLSKNVEGKSVLIFPKAEIFQDFFPVPFQGHRNGAHFQVMAARSIQSQYSNIAHVFLYLSILILQIISIIKFNRFRNFIFMNFSIFAGISVATFFLERNGYYLSIVPAFVSIAIFLFLSRVWLDRHRASLENTTDSVTGLPNGLAHARAIDSSGTASRIIVAATIANSADISCILDEANILEFFREVERRVLSSNGADAIYHAGYDSITWDVPRAIFPDVDDYAKAMRAMMLQPFIIDGKTIRADLSYGFDMDGGLNGYRRLANALNASQRAANANRLYSDSATPLDKSANWRVALSSSIDSLLADNQFRLVYQPKLNLASGEVDSAECLLRWTHPDFGTIPPSEFIAAAEQGSAIADLTDFSLRQALVSLAAIRALKPNFQLAVNLSPRLLDDPDLAARILTMIDDAGLDRSALILEITEAARLTDKTVAMDMLDALAKGCVPLSIDDYGTGRSTLDYLRVIPAKEVKLDRSFVGDMIFNDQNRNLVESTIKLAQTLNLSTVAEGVENKATLNMLKAMGCTYVQGYHIGWPSSYNDFTRKFILQSITYAA